MSDAAPRRVGAAVPMRPYWHLVLAVVRPFCRLVLGLEVRGREHVPPHGGCLLASNHVSFWDPVVVGAAAPRESWFLAKSELFAVPGFGPLIRAHNAIPIKRAASDRAGVDRATQLVGSGRALVIFPEGGRSIPGVFRPPRPGVGMIALDAGGAPIVPAYVTGTRPAWPSVFRRTRARVTFGPPIWPADVPELQGADDREAARILARLTMERIAALAGR